MSEKTKELRETLMLGCTFFSLFFIAVMYFQTSTILGRSERPIMSIPDIIVTKKINDEEKKFNFMVKILFKNIGKVPAKNFRMRFATCNVGDEKSLKMGKEVSLVNRIDPGFTINTEIIVSQEFKIVDEEKLTKPNETYFYILLNYDDDFTNKHFGEEYYLRYINGKSGVSPGEIEDKKKLEPFVQKLFKK